MTRQVWELSRKYIISNNIVSTLPLPLTLALIPTEAYRKPSDKGSAMRSLAKLCVVRPEIGAPGPDLPGPDLDSNVFCATEEDASSTASPLEVRVHAHTKIPYLLIGELYRSGVEQKIVGAGHLWGF